MGQFGHSNNGLSGGLNVGRRICGEDVLKIRFVVFIEGNREIKILGWLVCEDLKATAPPPSTCCFDLATDGFLPAGSLDGLILASNA